MKILDLTKEKDYTKLEEPANVIKNGGLVIFPTETVYGIGANGLDERAVNKIYIAKGRKTDNPLILHVSNKEMIYSITNNISKLEEVLIEKFMPGPFTIILNRKEIVPNIVTGGLDTVGIRMPNNEIALKLIDYAKTPIAAPSANISGKPSGTRIEDIMQELGDKVDFIINGGQTLIGVESTVVRVINNKIHILRPGKITKEDLMTVTNDVIIDNHILSSIKEDEKVLSPGMKYKHYAPNSKCVLVYSKDKEKMLNKMSEIAKEYNSCLILTRTANVNRFDNALDLGNSLEEISRNIFKLLRLADNYKKEIIIIEGVSKEGLGLAIMNRLIRACSYNYIEI